VTVAFWTHLLQIQFNRHATDIIFITGERAVFWRPRLTNGRYFPPNQFTAGRTSVSLNCGQRASLFSLKHAFRNPQI
jgi:hypothetical protein